MNKEDSPVKVIQGWTDPDIDMHPGRLSMSLLLRANANPGDVPCGVVIGSKAIPEGEVVKMLRQIQHAMVRDMIETSEGRLVSNPPAMEIAAIAKAFNITL